MGIFDFIADVVTLPLDVVADVSDSVQGNSPRHIKRKIQEIGDDLEDIVDSI